MHRYTQFVITKLFTLALILMFPTLIPLPPPYKRPIRDYKNTDSTNIQKSLHLVNWERLYDQKDITEQVVSFNEIILNLFRHYVPS